MERRRKGLTIAMMMTTNFKVGLSLSNKVAGIIF